MFTTRTQQSRKRGIRGLRGRLAFALVALAMLTSRPLLAADVSVTDISFSSKPGSIFEIRLDFDGRPPEPKAYTIEKPARISMDFDGVSSQLDATATLS